MVKADVLPNYKGRITHDCYQAYFKFENEHSLCNAHLLRELQYVIDNYPKQNWAKLLKEHILKLYRLKQQLIKKGQYYLPEDKLKLVLRKSISYLQLGFLENPTKPKPKKGRGRKPKGKILSLLYRITDHLKEFNAYLFDFDCSFTNNCAERSLRTIKTKSKVVGCFRTENGAQDYLDIISYLSTASKNKLNTFESILTAFNGSPCFV